jgi:cell division transport system permease protein
LTRLRVIGAESWRSLTANISTTLAATLTIVIAMFLLGLSIALGTLLLSYGASVKKQLQVNVFFCTPIEKGCSADATKAQEDSVAARLSRDPRVGKLDFVSKEEALKIMRKAHPDAVAALPANPFPDKLRVIPKKGEYTEAIANSLQPKPDGVQEVSFGKKETHTILGFAHALEIGFIVAVTMLVIAATLLVGNTIRLSIFARRREIEVMKLVGATNWFVRGPFMLEGIFCGLAGAFLAIFCLILGKEILLPIIPSLTNDPDVHAMGFSLTALMLLAVGIVVGAFGSGLTMRRFLRI